jgi:protein-disulfide isomerase
MKNRRLASWLCITFFSTFLLCESALPLTAAVRGQKKENKESQSSAAVRKQQDSALVVAGVSPVDPVVATVNSKAIHMSDLDRFIGKQAYELSERLYELRKAALESLTTTQALDEEAERRGLSAQALTRSLVPQNVQVPAEEMDQAFTEAQESRGNMTDGELRERIRLELEAREKLRQYRKTIADLQKKTEIRTFLAAPAAPVSEIAAIGPATGPEDAPVTIIEFSDFQCPYCKKAEPVVKQLLQEYGRNIRLVYRHMPLEEVHPFAFKAAKASLCANAQGKFWRYHDLLFQSAQLSDSLLTQLVSDVGLEPQAFQKCMEAKFTEAAVRKDIQDAGKVPVTGTPTFLINGKVIAGARSVDAFKEIIDQELQKTASQKRSSSPPQAGQD